MTISNIFNSDITIIFEGITGCGKTTQAKMLVDYLSKSLSVGYLDTSKVYPIIEPLRPTSPETAMEIIQESIFFQFMNWMRFGDRQNHDVNIIDRFLLSNCVYTLEKMQRYGIHHDPQKVRSTILNPLGLNPLQDTFTFYVECPLDIAQERTLQRQRNKFNMQQQENAQKLYLTEIGLYPQDLVIVDGSADPQTVHLKIVESLESILTKL